MNKRRFFRNVLAVSVLCLSFSTVALADELTDEQLIEPAGIEWIAEGDELYASNGHGSIEFDPTMYGAGGTNREFANNSMIELLFNVRSFGNDMEYYTIRVYKSGQVNVLARMQESFSKTVGSYNATYMLDTTDLSKFSLGEYTIKCSSYLPDETLVAEESINITLVDSRYVLDRDFVTRMYNTVLERNDDPAGLKFWSDRLYNGTSTGADIVNLFLTSEEFRNKNKNNEEYVAILYRSIFGRELDEGGREFWVGCLNDGMSRTYVLSGFVNSDEFADLCSSHGIVRGNIPVTEYRDRNRGITGFVNRLYVYALGRASDEAGLNVWTSELLAVKQTPKQVAHGFIFSKEMENKKLSNADFITVLYRAMMGREPDYSGLQNWTSQLNGKVMTREQVFDSFSKSTEFSNLVKSYGL